ncbi:MAG: alpha/beta fold hydrolase, partial [Elainella sp.]
ISGGRDITFTDSMAAELASHFRPSQRLHIPEAGHVVMAEYPELVNRTLANWLAAIPSHPIWARQSSHL